MSTSIRFIGFAVVAVLQLDCAIAQSAQDGTFGSRFRSGSPVMKVLDTDQDGELSAKEIDHSVSALKSLDGDGNGVLTQDEIRPTFRRQRRLDGGQGPARRQNRRSGRGRGNAPETVWTFLAEKYDSNKDGRLTRREYDRGAEAFIRLDHNRDGVLSAEDWDRDTGRFDRSTRQRRAGGLKDTAPKVGERAPDFELSYARQPDKTVRLSGFAGKKPVALIFGSCT